jgi:light-regulated signal transduction histidine kinase (bacteriophytochrome)
MSESAAGNLELALTTCDQEPIRFPGAIQPHGFVLCLSPQRLVLQASENAAPPLGRALDALLGQPLVSAFDAAAGATLQRELDATVLRAQPAYLTTLMLAEGRRYDVLGHAYDGLLTLEFEPTERTGTADFRHLGSLLGDFLLKLNDADSVAAMSQHAAQEMREVTGFGRVLVYRFDDEGHGHVLAESRDAAYDSYLGQRFPQSDIPRQARELYVRNRIRLIPNANYTPAPLVPVLHPLSGAPNDLAHAALRSVSPVHLQYMRNMGTLASMSVSLIVKGRLWGLISCHNATPLHPGFDRRIACEQLGQVLALRIESREDADELRFRLDLRRSMVEMLAGLTQGADFIDNMSSVFPQLLRFASAGGAALLVEDRLVTYGDAPGEEWIRELVAWIDLHASGEVFHTDRLETMYPPAAACAHQASGVLALPISRIHKHYLLWFRPERVQTIDWAGHPPDKSGPQAQLTPRTSFATWSETVRGTSARWHAGEIELALEFRGALLGIALERAEQMAELAEELGRANKELEAFSYSVSHDLRAPLRHIVGFADLLLETGENGAAGDGAKQHRFLKNIKDSARLAGKLVDDLLSFSQMGRAALHPSGVDMGRLVRGCIEKLGGDIGERRIDWQLGVLPEVRADPTFLQLALYNLLANAVKFTAQRDDAVIRIDGSATDDEVQFHIADNGVGFSMEYAHKLFGVFQRLHRMEDFQGTGIGLANVRRIIERHGGRVWTEGAVGQGATFSFSLPKILPL